MWIQSKNDCTPIEWRRKLEGKRKSSPGLQRRGELMGPWTKDLQKPQWPKYIPQDPKDSSATQSFKEGKRPRNTLWENCNSKLGRENGPEEWEKGREEAGGSLVLGKGEWNEEAETSMR